MTRWVALLRAVNLGAASTFRMADLRALCVAEGLADVRTFIASGNVVFAADAIERDIKALLEAAVARHAGKPISIAIRSANEMEAVLAANPFPDKATNRTVAVFLDEPTDPAMLRGIRHQTGERIALGRREIYIAYGDGMGTSKLVVPAAATGTARNMNTVAKLAEMARSGG